MNTLKSKTAAIPVEIKLYCEMFLVPTENINSTSMATDKIETAQINCWQFAGCMNGKGFSTG
jgi:hypothetical protein